MSISFPTSPTLNQTYTYIDKIWKWNGVAWERSAATETGNVEGLTGEIAYYYEKGSNIQGATAFFYAGDKIGIGTSGPTETLDVRGGITASGRLYAAGGITSGDDITVGDTIIETGGVFKSASGISLKTDGNITGVIDGNTELFMSGAESIFNYDTSSGHNFKVRGPSGLYPIFANDSGVGINVNTQGPQELFHVAGGMSAGGATFDEVTVHGGITASGALYAAQGITSGGHIVLQNNDYISNPSAYNVRMMPEGTSATDYGLNFDFSSWGYGVKVDTVKASDDSGGSNVLFMSDLGVNNDRDINMGSSSHSKFRHCTTGNNTLQVGVQPGDVTDDCAGAFALIHSSHIGTSFRCPGVTHANPNFYVYTGQSNDADKYIRIEHDATDANIVTGAGDISLQPSSGVVGVSGGRLYADQGITSGGDIHLDGDIIMTDQGYIKVEGDTESIYMNASGGQIKLGATAIDIKQKLRHAEDTDTYLEFTTNNISLQAGGTDVLNITSTGANFADTDVVRPNLKDYSETVNAIGTITDDRTIAHDDGNVQTVTVGGDCEIDFDTWPASGKSGTVTLIITNGGAHTTTWHSSVKWPGDNAPALTASGVDILSFMSIDAGTTVYGFVGGINFS